MIKILRPERDEYKEKFLKRDLIGYAFILRKNMYILNCVVMPLNPIPLSKYLTFGISTKWLFPASGCMSSHYFPKHLSSFVDKHKFNSVHYKHKKLPFSLYNNL